jgi:uncharacterized protein DUF4340
MKIRGLVVAALVFFILAGVLYWSNHHKPGEDTGKASADTPPVILKFDQNAINRVELKKKDAEPILLTKNDAGAWQITEPKPLRADQSTVSGVLSSLSSLNSDRVIEDKASDLKRYGFDPPSLEADISEKDKKTKKLLFGDDTFSGSAVYAMLAGDPRLFTVSTYTKNAIDKSLNELRDKRLLTVDSDKISRVELLRKNQDIEFGRSKDEWQILKPKPLRADNTQVDELVRKLTDARMDLSAASDKDVKNTASEFAKATPVATAKVTDQSGTQELQVRKSKDTYFAKSSVADGAYKVSSDIGQALDKGLDDFRNKKLFDFGFTDPNKIDLRSGSKSYLLERNKEDWWSNGKKLDPETTEALISKLRDLAAVKFVDSGFVKPEIEATVTSDNGKRAEKISISKSGNRYIAKRENDSSLYEIDSNSVDDLLERAADVKPAAATSK